MRKLLTIFLLLFVASLTNGQKLTKDQIKLFRDADDLLFTESYELAVENYLKLYEEIQDTGVVYKIAYCYYHIPGKQKDAITYFERYLALDDSLNEAYYLLGLLYHQDYRFNDAIDMYSRFKETVDHDVRMTADMRIQIHEMLDRQVSYCNYAKIAMSRPRQVVVENLGEEVNSKYPEYAPVVSLDERTLLFTARRPETIGGKLFADGHYYEDVYYTNLLKGSLFDEREAGSLEAPADYIYLVTDFEYSMLEQLQGEVNTKNHEGAIQLSGDGNVLYFYRDNDVWKATFKDSLGVDEERMGSNINSRSYEPSVYFSIDESVMYVVSDRPGGYGGLDIYRSFALPNGDWSPLENLGPNINSKWDEDAPYLDPSGDILYFSSKGHSSMGGYDVFRSKWKEDHWGSAGNIGFPVNSPGDDIYYVMTPRYNRAYYSSDRIGGYGDMDLYRITFTDERTPLAEILGLVLEGNELVPVRSQITLRENESFDELATLDTDSVNGDYLLLVGHGETYDMVVETDGFVPYLKTFDIPEQVDYYQLYQEIHHVYLYDEDGNIIGQVVTMYNAFFDVEAHVEVDSAVYYYENKAQYYSDYLDRIQEHPEFYEFMDVKYYVTENDYMRLIEKDSTLHVVFPEHATVSFLAEDSLDHMLMENYDIYSTDGSVPGQVVINEIADVETLEQLIESGTDEEGSPDIMLYFDYGSADVTTGTEKEVGLMVEYMQRNPEVKFLIEGHTDDWGSAGFNQNLSRNRAKGIYDLMVAAGIDPSRLDFVGRGEDFPIAPNAHEDGSDNPEGREKNRRVQFVAQ